MSILLAGLAASSFPFTDTPAWFGVLVGAGMVMMFNVITWRLSIPSKQYATATLRQSLAAIAFSIVWFALLLGLEHLLSY